jgi:glycosyltransferase involved in cell wall biosynthesis
MSKNLLTAHCLIRNEERWIWYAINSVIKYVDQVVVFDTGSTDNTVKIIKSIKNPKIVFEEKGIVDKKAYVNLRQEMLDRTRTKWFMVLDGDEVWPEIVIKELNKSIFQADKSKEAIIVRQWTCLGDIFHYSRPLASVKQPGSPDGYFGFCMPRAIRKIPGLHCIGEYGYESYADKKGVNISDWNQNRLIFLKNNYWHMTFLPRSSSRKKDSEVMMRQYKTLYYKGQAFPKNTNYPEVFYLLRPDFVLSPWQKFTWRDYIKGIYYRSRNLLARFLNP